MSEVINRNWRTILLACSQIIIAGLIATGNSKLVTTRGASVADQSEENSYSLSTIGRQIDHIDRRSRLSELWILNFVRQHPERESAPLPGVPNEIKKGGE